MGYDWERGLKVYRKGRLLELQEDGLSGVLASKVVNAEVRVIEAVEKLFSVCEEIEKTGKSGIVGMIWAGIYAKLLIAIPKQIRKEFMEAVLKMAEEMEKEEEKEE